MEQRLAGLMRFVAGNEGVSAARASRQLGLARSELQRLLAVLGEDPALGGLGLVHTIADGARDRLALTPRGHEWMARHR